MERKHRFIKSYPKYIALVVNYTLSQSKIVPINNLNILFLCDKRNKLYTDKIVTFLSEF